MFVVDASVWVSRFLPADAHHELARDWIALALERSVTIYAPAVLLPELAGSVARVSGDPVYGFRAAELLTSLRLVDVVPGDAASYLDAANLASRLRLRGCDALYVQVARELNCTLVSLDAQQVERSSGLISSTGPEDVDILQYFQDN